MLFAAGIGRTLVVKISLALADSIALDCGVGVAIDVSAFVFLIASSVAFCFARLVKPTRYIPKRHVVVGTPNYFPDLRGAGSTLTESGLADGYQPVLPSEALATKLEENKSAFDKVELALNAENCFCVDWTQIRFDFDVVTKSGDLRGVARALSTRSLQALSEGRHDDVIKDGLLCLKLADRISTDGTLVQGMVGAAIEGIGVGVIVPGIDGASEIQLNALASQLDDMMAWHRSEEAEFGAWSTADNYFMWNSTVTYWLDPLTFSFVDMTLANDAIRAMIVRRDTLRELLRTEIAIVLYRSTNGQVPETLDLSLIHI